MAWFFIASHDSDPEFLVGSIYGKRKSTAVQRFVGELAIEETEPITIRGWKRPSDAEDWSVELDDDPDVTIQIGRR